MEQIKISIFVPTLINGMIKKRLLLVICLAFEFVLHAQNLEAKKLLGQAEEMVFYNPSETKTIVAHIQKLKESDIQKEELLYLSALASYVMGNYDEALVEAFEAESLSDENNQHLLKAKSLVLINRILNYLQLKEYDLDKELNTESTHGAMLAALYLRKAHSYLLKNKMDSVDFYVKKSVPYLNMDNLGYSEMIYYCLKGDVLFNQKKFESSLESYKIAESIDPKINNPFLSEEIHSRLAANYLALDSITQFQQNSESVKQLNIVTTDIENRASNQAHSLMIKDLDKDLTEKRQRLQLFLGILSFLLAMGLVVKLLFYIRNRNKLKMFSRLSEYLKAQEKEAPVSIEIRESKHEKEGKLEKSTPKSGSILKESEEHLLAELEKFESTKKFTHKDMSLGKLAAQLGTNTKYLSEVINRHKERNFNMYINELRIHYITEKLKSNPTYLNYKVSYLADECGFSSHSSFTTVFKTIVGVSPSTFVEFLKEEKEIEISESA